MESASGMISARVTLPMSVDTAVRTATSSATWMTERMAKKDAAFEAYRALYKEGLVNDNLLPATEEADDELVEHNTKDHTPSLVQASPTLDPWPLIAQVQHNDPHAYKRTLLTLRGIEERPIHMVLLTPISLPTVDVALHWNVSTCFKAESLSLSDVALDNEGT
jgi:hypothetical protein